MAYAAPVRYCVSPCGIRGRSRVIRRRFISLLMAQCAVFVSRMYGHREHRTAQRQQPESETLERYARIGRLLMNRSNAE